MHIIYYWKHKISIHFYTTAWVYLGLYAHQLVQSTNTYILLLGRSNPTNSRKLVLEILALSSVQAINIVQYIHWNQRNKSPSIVRAIFFIIAHFIPAYLSRLILKMKWIIKMVHNTANQIFLSQASTDGISRGGNAILNCGMIIYFALYYKACTPFWCCVHMSDIYPCWTMYNTLMTHIYPCSIYIYFPTPTHKTRCRQNCLKFGGKNNRQKLDLF